MNRCRLCTGTNPIFITFYNVFRTFHNVFLLRDPRPPQACKARLSASPLFAALGNCPFALDFRPISFPWCPERKQNSLFLGFLHRVKARPCPTCQRTLTRCSRHHQAPAERGKPCASRPSVEDGHWGVRWRPWKAGQKVWGGQHEPTPLGHCCLPLGVNSLLRTAWGAVTGRRRRQ